MVLIFVCVCKAINFLYDTVPLKCDRYGHVPQNKHFFSQGILTGESTIAI